MHSWEDETGFALRIIVSNFLILVTNFNPTLETAHTINWYSRLKPTHISTKEIRLEFSWIKLKSIYALHGSFFNVSTK